MTYKDFAELLLNTAGFELVSWNMDRINGVGCYDGEAKRDDEYITFSGQFDDVFIAQMVKNLREKYDKTKRIDVELENYFNETPPEKVKEDWEKLEEFDSTENSK